MAPRKGFKGRSAKKAPVVESDSEGEYDNGAQEEMNEDEEEVFNLAGGGEVSPVILLSYYLL